MIPNSVADSKEYVRNENYVSGSSFPEQFIFKSMLQVFPRTLSRYKENGLEFDVYIPEIDLRIEYNGCKFHLESERALARDMLKRDYCMENDLPFIQIFEYPKARKIVADPTGIYTMYRFKPDDKNKNATMDKLILIIEDILDRIGKVHHIDYVRSFYEALAFSMRFMYSTRYDYNSKEIKIECLGKAELQKLEHVTAAELNQELHFKNVIRTDDLILCSEYDELNTIDSRLEHKRKELQQKERELNRREQELAEKEKEMAEEYKYLEHIATEMLEHKHKEVFDMLEDLVNRKIDMNKREESLNEKEKEQVEKEKELVEAEKQLEEREAVAQKQLKSAVKYKNDAVDERVKVQNIKRDLDNKNDILISIARGILENYELKEAEA